MLIFVFQSLDKNEKTSSWGWSLPNFMSRKDTTAEKSTGMSSWNKLHYINGCKKDCLRIDQ